MPGTHTNPHKCPRLSDLMGSPEPCLWFLGFPDVGWWDGAGVCSCRSRWAIVQVAPNSTFNFKTKNPLQAARTVHTLLGRTAGAGSRSQVSWEARGGRAPSWTPSAGRCQLLRTQGKRWGWDPQGKRDLEGMVLHFYSHRNRKGIYLKAKKWWMYVLVLWKQIIEPPSGKYNQGKMNKMKLWRECNNRWDSKSSYNQRNAHEV